jgi:hypothetical protein
MIRLRWASRVLFFAPLLAACKEAPLTCPKILAPSVAVTVRDSVTGTFVASGATVIAYSTLYSDTVSVPFNRPDLDAQPVELAYGQSGPFLVTVDRMGYSEWMKTAVVVRSDVCGRETTQLTARLQPLP